MVNPYLGFGCPVSGEDFVGRKEILEAVVEILRKGNVFLTGLHRMGKSSVAQEALRKLESGGTAVCKIVNLHTVKTECDLFRLMLMALGSPAAKTLTTDDDFMAFIETQEAFEAKRRERSSRCVMVIDEFDGILSFPDPVTTTNRLRDLAYYPDKYGVNFMFVSSRSLDSIERKIAGSNLPGICKNCFLQPFDLDEAEAFVAKSGILGDDAFVHEAYAQTGGVPYLMAALMSEFCKQADGRQAEMSHEDRMVALTGCVSAASHMFLEYYEKIRRTLSDEGNAWGELIGAVIGPTVADHDPLLANLFREYGIICEDGSCPSSHFMDYLEMCSREIAPFDDLRSVEVNLRKIVKDKLGRKFGGGWADVVCSELPAAAKGLEKARESLRREMRQFHLATDADLIEFTDLGDITTIVTSKAYWPLFQHPIGMGVADFKKHMDRIIPMRNRTMHHRPGHLLLPEQVAMARESCKALLARICNF